MSTHVYWWPLHGIAMRRGSILTLYLSKGSMCESQDTFTGEALCVCYEQVGMFSDSCDGCAGLYGMMILIKLVSGLRGQANHVQGS
eukprot:TRINITY_DN14705_c0_g1_i1.p2 TRINITY_DN14705_c0_g1~~TRINITY_DN14705_c0_g1_i1.p2  ORF type:complete len:101 (+),score=0.15 TRINITY_DN14705_c0_g1_i1:46-303(+)